MRNSKKIPVVSGLLGRDAGSISGQLEVSLLNDGTVQIAIWREAYSGLSDVEFSVADTDLQDMIDILIEAKEKVDAHWLSKVAVESQAVKGQRRKNKQF